MKLYWTESNNSWLLLVEPAVKLLTLCSNNRTFVLKSLGREFELPRDYNLEQSKKAAIEWFGLLLLEVYNARMSLEEP